MVAPGPGYGAFRPPGLGSAARGSPYGTEEITTIWVGNLPAVCSDEALLACFAGFGAIRGASISARPAPSGARNGFVRFAARAQAEQALAVSAAGQVYIGEEPLVCQWARANSFGGLSCTGESAQSGAAAGPEEAREELATLWLGNLPMGATDGSVAEAFSFIGQVLTASVHQKPSAQGSYSGFVRFATRREAESALSFVTIGSVLVEGIPCIARWARVNSKIDTSRGQLSATSLGSGVQPPPSAAAAVAERAPLGAMPTGGLAVHLSNLPPDAMEPDVRQAFWRAGLTDNIRVEMLGSPTSCRSAVVKFETMLAGQDAVNLMSAWPPTINGKIVTVDWSVDPSRQ